jgi:hypothetical protein
MGKRNLTPKNLVQEMWTLHDGSDNDDEDESEKAMTFRKAHMPPKEYPPGRHLDKIKKGIAVENMAAKLSLMSLSPTPW